MSQSVIKPINGGFNASTYGSIQIIRCGSMRIMNSLGLISGIVSQTIPTDDRPMYNLYAPVTIVSNDFKQTIGSGLLTINPSGGIGILVDDEIPSGTYRAVINATWIAIG